MDVPPMCIKDVRITEDGKLRHYFPLSESTGATAADTKQGRKALVTKPGMDKTQASEMG